MKKLTAGKTYYSLADIQYLSHEPIIWKFWQTKIFVRRLKRAQARKDFDSVDTIRDNRPVFRLNHIVKERYPTFIDAVKDLDDALSMIFLYRRFAKSPHIPPDLIHLCHRLSVEFMHIIIETRSLRKVFVSVKGYYFQVEIQGQVITWVAPHEFVIPKLADVDVKVMKTFTEFYVHMLGFVNFKLFRLNGLVYPPKVKAIVHDQEATHADLIDALNRPLVKQDPSKTDEQQPDTFEEDDVTGVESQKANTDEMEVEGEEVKSAVGLTYAQTVKLQNLFEGLKIFLNREIPRQYITFVLRSFGAQVSWCQTATPGSTFSEDDKGITHQIVDREVKSPRLDRVYIQPQWVFDCVNARMLLPVQEYFPGVTLPPHLSPFEDNTPREGRYVTPDAARLKGEKPKPIETDSTAVPSAGKKKKPHVPQIVAKPAKEGVEAYVKAGKQVKTNKERDETLLGVEEKKLREMMIPKKKKRLYDKIIKLKKIKGRQADKLKQRRVAFEKGQQADDS